MERHKFEGSRYAGTHNETQDTRGKRSEKCSATSNASRGRSRQNTPTSRGVESLAREGGKGWHLRQRLATGTSPSHTFSQQMICAHRINTEFGSILSINLLSVKLYSSMSFVVQAAIGFHPHLVLSLTGNTVRNDV